MPKQDDIMEGLWSTVEATWGILDGKKHSLIFVGMGRFAGEDNEMSVEGRESCANGGGECRLRE